VSKQDNATANASLDIIGNDNKIFLTSRERYRMLSISYKGRVFCPSGRRWRFRPTLRKRGGSVLRGLCPGWFEYTFDRLVRSSSNNKCASINRLLSTLLHLNLSTARFNALDDTRCKDADLMTIYRRSTRHVDGRSTVHILPLASIDYMGLFI